MKLPGLPNLGAFNSVKLGSGVLGKTSPVMIAFILLVAVAVWKIPPDLPYMILGLVLLAAALVVAFGYKAFGYAERHPGPSVLEGAHLVEFRQNEIAASDPKIIDHSPAGAQGTLPPAQLRMLGEDRDV